MGKRLKKPFHLHCIERLDVEQKSLESEMGNGPLGMGGGREQQKLDVGEIAAISHSVPPSPKSWRYKLPLFSTRGGGSENIPVPREICKRKKDSFSSEHLQYTDTWK